MSRARTGLAQTPRRNSEADKVHWGAAGLLVLAGTASGLVGYGAGLASLVSYPALLAVGLSPVSANVSNTVAVTFAAVGGLSTAGPELRPQRRRVIRYALAGSVGGAVGAGLLLTTPAEEFALLVPWLVAAASTALLVQPWLRLLMSGRVWRGRVASAWLHHQHVAMFLFVTAVAVYGGYFGAAAGVVLLAAFGAVLREGYAQINALKSMVLGAANVTASLLFALFAPVDWTSVAPLALGCLIGAAISPPLVRRLPETPLRIAVGLAGLALAVHLYLS